MSPTVYLHIGAPKTGTTYLQDRLELNARSLARHGVHYPSRNPVTSASLSQFRAALDLLGQDWGGSPGHAQGYWEAMVRRIRRLDGSVVLSHEILAPASPDQVARVRHDLRGCELHVVYTARDQGRQLPAAWQESIKQGRRWSYRRYVRRVTGGQPWLAQAFDLPEVLATWGEGLPPERVHVVTVPHRRGDELWLRFCRATGIDPAWAPRDSERANRSLGVAETQLLRKLNRRMVRKTRREPAYDELVRGLLAERMLVNRKAKPLRMPPAMHPWAVAEAERWAAWIAESGVEVIGDVADLVPAPPVPEEQYVDPDRVNNKAQLSVALDALVAMTAEAARRDDPDDRLATKLRDRLRELRGE